MERADAEAHSKSVPTRTAPLLWGQAQHWLPYLGTPAGERWREHILVDWPVPDGVEPQTALGWFDRLIARHESLRTRYTADTNGDPVQVIEEITAPQTEICDVTGEKDPFAVAREFAVRLCREDLDLAAAPPLRFGMVLLDDQVRWAFLAIHHIAADGVAVELLRAELQDMICQRALPWPVPGQPVQEADFEASAAGRALEDRTAAYWRDTARSYPLTSLPVRHRLSNPRRAAEGVLYSPVAEQVGELAHRFGMPATTIVLGAWAQLLRTYTGNHRTALKISVSNRTRRRIVSTVGSFAQVLPVVLDLPDRGPLRAVFEQARQAELTALRYGRFNPDIAAEAIATARFDRGVAMDSLPAYNFLPALSTPEPGERDQRGYSWQEVESSPSSPAQLRIRMHDRSLRIALRHEITMFQPDEVERLLLAMETMLRLAADSPDGAIEDLVARADPPVADRAGGWWRIGGSWVSTDATADLIARHPAVTAAIVSYADDQLVAHVAVTEPVPAFELRCAAAHVLHDHPGAVLPDRLVVLLGGTTLEDGPGRELATTVTDTSRHQALEHAFATANPMTGNAWGTKPYLLAGGRLSAGPRLIRELASAGYSGVTYADLSGCIPAHHICAQLKEGQVTP